MVPSLPSEVTLRTGVVVVVSVLGSSASHTVSLVLGQYCYELDETAVRPGYPKLIKDVWGIEGPIDAAFTRINCQGKTYLFKVPDLQSEAR